MPDAWCLMQYSCGSDVTTDARRQVRVTPYTLRICMVALRYHTRIVVITDTRNARGCAFLPYEPIIVTDYNTLLNSGIIPWSPGNIPTCVARNVSLALGYYIDRWSVRRVKSTRTWHTFIRSQFWVTYYWFTVSMKLLGRGRGLKTLQVHPDRSIIASPYCTVQYCSRPCKEQWI